MKLLLFRVRSVAVLAALAVAVAVPGIATGKTHHHGNQCGKGHAKHSKAVGKLCTKHNGKSSRAALRREAVTEHESLGTEKCESDHEGDQGANEQNGENNQNGETGDHESEQAGENESEQAGENESDQAGENDNEQAGDHENGQCDNGQDD